MSWYLTTRCTSSGRGRSELGRDLRTHRLRDADCEACRLPVCSSAGSPELLPICHPTTPVCAGGLRAAQTASCDAPTGLSQLGSRRRGREQTPSRGREGAANKGRNVIARIAGEVPPRANFRVRVFAGEAVLDAGKRAQASLVEGISDMRVSIDAVCETASCSTPSMKRLGW